MFKKYLFILYIFLVFLLVILYYRWQAYVLLNQNLELKQINIARNEPASEIIRQLKSQGVIESEIGFKVYAYLRNRINLFQPGRYYLNPAMSWKEVINFLTAKMVNEQLIIIREGWTQGEIGAYLEKSGLFSRQEFLDACYYLGSSGILDYDFLADKPNNYSLEGYLFPDTYRIYRDAKPETVIKKMLDNFDVKLDSGIKEEIARQYKSIFEVLILASIIEKEAANEIDRRLVADIFLRRLKIGMPLQSCATINYILPKKKTRLSIEDTRIELPYNTYKYRGLPPGPIGNPGLSSIKSVLQPSKNDYWYFLSTDDGQIIYSKTKEEHDAAKQKYLN
ncbi:MAG: endolytic transglycosylase MltG [Patescibacteria group bacterium]